jgi:hypothetical protein
MTIKLKSYTANCFRKFVYLGNNEISESEIKGDINDIYNT